MDQETKARVIAIKTGETPLATAIVQGASQAGGGRADTGYLLNAS